jgi:hypothetical protein
MQLHNPRGLWGCMIDTPHQPPPARPPPSEAEIRLFDRWMREDLLRRFGRPGDEPVPDTLLRIITEH